jgi:hypothetical protein
MNPGPNTLFRKAAPILVALYPETNEKSREFFYSCGLFDRYFENPHAVFIRRTIEFRKEIHRRVAPNPITGLA